MISAEIFVMFCNFFKNFCHESFCSVVPEMFRRDTYGPPYKRLSDLQQRKQMQCLLLLKKTGLKYVNTIFIFNFFLFFTTVSRQFIIIDLQKNKMCRKV